MFHKLCPNLVESRSDSKVGWIVTHERRLFTGKLDESIKKSLILFGMYVQHRSVKSVPLVVSRQFSFTLLKQGPASVKRFALQFRHASDHLHLLAFVDVFFAQQIGPLFENRQIKFLGQQP